LQAEEVSPVPFKSKSQQRKCFAMKARGQAKGWDCRAWAHETKGLKHLPEKAKSKKKK
jgi:hypothetical protein